MLRPNAIAIPLPLLFLLAASCADSVDPAVRPMPPVATEPGSVDVGGGSGAADTPDAAPQVGSPDAGVENSRDSGVGSGEDGAVRPDADASPPPPGTVPEDGDGLVIVATWNVRNFFDDVCDSGRCGPDDYEPALSAPQFAFKTRMVSEGVDALQADVVLLQEVENERAMNALLAAQNGRWPVAVLGETGFAASVDVLVLSRGELLEVRTHRDRPLPQPSGRDTRFAREFLEVHVEIEGQRVIVFNAHFRSKNADDPERRWAEASLAAEILRERRQEFRDALIVLGGDLNDEPGSPTLQNIERSGHYEGIWRELPATDGSYFFGGAPRMIDHLYHCVDCGGRYLEGSATLLGERGQAFQTSDHRPVRAVYRLSGEAP